MKWKYKQLKLNVWERHFAWLPTCLSKGQWIWLEFYEKRCTDRFECWAGVIEHWEYREID